MLFFTDGTLLFFLFRLFRRFSNIEYHFCYKPTNQPTNQSITSTSSAVTPKTTWDIIFWHLINAYEYSPLVQNSIIGMRLLPQRLLQESH